MFFSQNMPSKKWEFKHWRQEETGRAGECPSRHYRGNRPQMKGSRPTEQQKGTEQTRKMSALVWTGKSQKQKIIFEILLAYPNLLTLGYISSLSNHPIVVLFSPTINYFKNMPCPLAVTKQFRKREESLEKKEVPRFYSPFLSKRIELQGSITFRLDNHKLLV